MDEGFWARPLRVFGARLASAGLAAAFLVALPLAAVAQGKVTEGFGARGCCPWCGENIEAALEGRGVKQASWDQFEQRVTVTYRPRKTSLRELQQRVADAGHDTDAVQAPDAAYFALPGCCRYRE
jgi:copper chaperone CopZ